MEPARVFIAVDIGDEIRGRLDALQHTLKKGHSNVRWTQPKNMHLTLAFLGDVPIAELDRVTSGIDRACRDAKAFELKANGIGTFGKTRHPRVIWAGLAACPALTALQLQVGEALLAAEIAFDQKPFSPHLTLGRIKSVDSHTPSLLGKLEVSADMPFGSGLVSGVELMKSELTPRGAEYTVLHRVELKQRN
jgi:2'-5' RNA ligase